MTPQVGVPIAGYYACRLIRGGLRVPVKIWWGLPIIDGEEQDRSPRWCCEVDGRTDRIERDPETGEPTGQRVPLDPILDDVWIYCCGQPIKQREYLFLRRRAEWAREHAPDHPAARPREKIDIRLLKPGF